MEGLSGCTGLGSGSLWLDEASTARPYTLLAVGSWLFLSRWMRSARAGDLAGYTLATVGVVYTPEALSLVSLSITRFRRSGRGGGLEPVSRSAFP